MLTWFWITHWFESWREILLLLSTADVRRNEPTRLFSFLGRRSLHRDPRNLVLNMFHTLGIPADELLTRLFGSLPSRARPQR